MTFREASIIMRDRSTILVLAVAASLALAGCGKKTTEPPPPGGGGTGGGTGTTHTVNIQNFAFNQATLTIPAGDKVQWKNLDSSAHTATSDNGGAINTGSLSQNATSTAVTFSGAGTFTYHCAFHASMLGTIVVQ